MPPNTKLCTPLETLSVTATGAIEANLFGPPGGAQAGAGDNTLGVSRTEAAIGDLIGVDTLGTAVVEAGAAISLGASLESDESGRAITWASSGAKVGIAREAAPGAGYFLEVQLVANVA